MQECEIANAMMIWRVVEQRGEYAFEYDERRDRLVKVPDNEDKTLADNSGRIATFLRYTIQILKVVHLF